jgi:hypothetical protein
MRVNGPIAYNVCNFGGYPALGIDMVTYGFANTGQWRVLVLYRWGKQCNVRVDHHIWDN